MNRRPHMKSLLILLTVALCALALSLAGTAAAHSAPTGWTWDDSGVLIGPDGWTWDGNDASLPRGWTWDD